MATTNENPTLAELRAIETDWNTVIDAEYATVAAKYSDIDFDDVFPKILSRADEVATLHPITSEPLAWVLSRQTLSRVLQPREVINAIKKRSLKVNVSDDTIEHYMQIHSDEYGFVSHLTSYGSPVSDTTIEDSSVIPGITTQLAANKVNIVTHDDGRKEIQISYD